MKTLRIRIDNGKLSAEYSETDKNDYIDDYEIDGYFNESFQPITLSQQAEEYLRKTYPANISETEFGKSLELSGKDFDCFYVDDVQLGIVKDERVKILHLKTVTPNESEDCWEWDIAFQDFYIDNDKNIYKWSDEKKLILEYQKWLKLNFHITKK